MNNSHYFDALMGVKRDNYQYFDNPGRFRTATHMRFICVINGKLSRFEPAGRQLFSNYEDRLLMKLNMVYGLSGKSLYASVKELRTDGNQVQVFELNKNSKTSKDKYEVFL